MRARITGLGCLALAGLLGYTAVYERFTTYRALAALPFLASTGLWMLVFGYPVGPDGLAPRWWRLGLAALIVAAITAGVLWSPTG